MTKGEKVVKKAFEYLGVREAPYGSNRGKDIDRWEARWGMQGQPWCGMFTDAMFAEANVDDAKLHEPVKGSKILRVFKAEPMLAVDCPPAMTIRPLGNRVVV